MSKDAIFRLYSMTKPFVSVAAMMLAEEGKLTLADPVLRNISRNSPISKSRSRERTLTARRRTRSSKRTLRPLFRICCGIRLVSSTLWFTPNERVKAAYSTLGVMGEVTPTEQIERLAQAPLAHQPGTTWSTSISTDILGRVIEKVSRHVARRDFSLNASSRRSSSGTPSSWCRQGQSPAARAAFRCRQRDREADHAVRRHRCAQERRWRTWIRWNGWRLRALSADDAERRTTLTGARLLSRATVART